MIDIQELELLELAEELEQDYPDQGDNADFFLAIDAPRIREIQGSGLRSPLLNANDPADTQAVTNVPGIVTAIANNGFYLQDPNPDDNLATSEGIFVFTGANRLNRLITDGSIALGNSIKVSGSVTEFLPSENATNLTVTQISATANANTITKVSVGNPLPAPVLISTEGRIPPTAIIAADNVPFAETGIGFYESLEGMRVTVKDTIAVSPTRALSNNSDIWVLANRGANATGINSSGGITIAPGDFNPERIQIDDGFLRRNGLPYSLPLVNVGDFLGDVTGVSSYSVGNYEILVTEPPLSTSGGRQKEITSIVPTPDRLTIASYNVENLNPFSGERFDVLAEQIVSNLRSPDIIGLQEIQDNNGPIDDGTVAAYLTYQALINSIEVLGGITYNYVNIDPEDGQDGGQQGSNIRVGYLYNPARVDLA